MAIALLRAMIPANGRPRGNALAAHVSKNKDKEVMADAISNDICEVSEFMFLADDAGVGGADEVLSPSASAVEYETTVFSFRTTTAIVLREIAKEILVQYMGAKRVLWDRIIKSGNPLIITMADDVDTFKIHRMRAALSTSKVPTWIILTPEPVPSIEGIDMDTGAERGFFGPTNPNNTTGLTRSNFCTAIGERIDFSSSDYFASGIASEQEWR